MTTPCPCGRTSANPAKPSKTQPLPFSTCCGPYLNENIPAPDAEALMRSRYSAFVLERADYLLATWHASTRPAALDFAPGAKWLGLDVRSHTVLDADHAEVEFVPDAVKPAAPRACTSAAALCASRGAGFMSMAISFRAKQAVCAMQAGVDSY